MIVIIKKSQEYIFNTSYSKAMFKLIEGEKDGTYFKAKTN